MSFCVPIYAHLFYLAGKSLYNTSTHLHLISAEVVRWTGHLPTSFPSPEPWCHLAYWELGERCGHLAHVVTGCCHVYLKQSGGTKGGSCCVSSSGFPAEPAFLGSDDFLDLGLLDCQGLGGKRESLFEDCERKGKNVACRPRRAACVQSVRAKIGTGITLFRLSSHPTRVWLYNRSSTCCVFVKSSKFHAPRAPAVKVPCGYCVMVHEFDLKQPCFHRPDSLKRTGSNSHHDSSLPYSQEKKPCVDKSHSSNKEPSFRDLSQPPPVLENPALDSARHASTQHTALISFAKGWGETGKYSRRFVTSCPCWVEVFFES